MAVGDFNGDGKADLAVANLGSNNVAVLLGNGNGTFATAVTYASGGTAPFSVAVGDFNGDGKLDLAVANDRHQHRERCCWATATAPSHPPLTYASGGTASLLRGGGGLQRRRQARPRRRQLLAATR